MRRCDDFHQFNCTGCFANVLSFIVNSLVKPVSSIHSEQIRFENNYYSKIYQANVKKIFKKKHGGFN